MSISAVNLTYIGQGPSSGGGQILNDNTPGPKGRSVVGYGQATLDGNLSAFTVNFIDGVATFGKSFTLRVQSVAASDGTNSVYSSTDACGQVKVGDTVTVRGCTVSANNVTAAAVKAVTSSTITVANTSGTAESGLFGATMVDYVAATPVALLISRSGAATDTAAVGTTIEPSAISTTGFTANISTAGSSAQLLSFCVEIFFAS